MSWLGFTLPYTYHRGWTQTDSLSAPSLWPQCFVQGERVPKGVYWNPLGKSGNRYKKNVGLFPSRTPGRVSLELPVPLLNVKRERLVENEDNIVVDRAKEQRK